MRSSMDENQCSQNAERNQASSGHKKTKRGSVAERRACTVALRGSWTTVHQQRPKKAEGNNSFSENKKQRIIVDLAVCRRSLFCTCSHAFWSTTLKEHLAFAHDRLRFCKLCKERIN